MSWQFFEALAGVSRHSQRGRRDISVESGLFMTGELRQERHPRLSMQKMPPRWGWSPKKTPLLQRFRTYGAGDGDEESPWPPDGPERSA